MRMTTTPYDGCANLDEIRAARLALLEQEFAARLKSGADCEYATPAGMTSIRMVVGETEANRLRGLVELVRHDYASAGIDEAVYMALPYEIEGLAEKRTLSIAQIEEVYYALLAAYAQGYAALAAARADVLAAETPEAVKAVKLAAE